MRRRTIWIDPRRSANPFRDDKNPTGENLGPGKTKLPANGVNSWRGPVSRCRLVAGAQMGLEFSAEAPKRLRRGAQSAS